MTPLEKLQALREHVADTTPPEPTRRELWEAMPPEMQAHIKKLGATFGRMHLKSLEIDGKRWKGS